MADKSDLAQLETRFTTRKPPTWLHVGGGTWLHIPRIVAFVNVGTKARAIRRWVSSVESRCIDVTGGRKTRSAVLMDDGTVFLSSVTAYTLAKDSVGR